MYRHLTIVHALSETARGQTNRGFTFQDEAGNETFWSFARIEAETGRRAAGLQEQGLAKGDRMGMVITDPETFVLTFLAALRVGVVPVPLYPPMYLGNLGAYMNDTAAILESAGASVLCVSNDVLNLLGGMLDRVPSLRRLVAATKLSRDVAPSYPELAPDDLAFLQYTSGSTSRQKGVRVTHGTLIANIHAFVVDGLALDPEVDVGVSWLPLYHDMGLIGFVLGPIYTGISVVFIPTLRFIKRVSCWLETVHRHRGTISFAPNFAFALMTKRVKPAELERWDLSCAKNFGIAAEPIHIGTCREFVELFGKRCNFPATALAPAYGLAEATLAVSLKPLDEVVRVLPTDARRFREEGRVVPPSEGSEVLEHVSCGRGLPGFEIAIANDAGEPVGDGFEGEILLRGPSVTPGYYNDEEHPVAIDESGWLHTGDLGFCHEGHLYVTGRIKDLIIINGRNFHPQAIEWVATEIEGVRRGNVVAFSRPGEISEEVVVVAETNDGGANEVAEAIGSEIQRQLGIVPAEILCVAAGSLPKTSSGKLQRQKVRQIYLAGRIGVESYRDTGNAIDRLQVVGHMVRSMWARAKASIRSK
jgi:fatty-acyl-CoA synthase